MNKYYVDVDTSYDRIESYLMDGEEIIWQGTPRKSAYIINSSSKMLPVALLWLCFDGFFIVSALGSGGFGGMGLFLLIFFAFHLMPVWIWLSNVITAGARWKNTEYAVTNRRILIRNGLVGYQYQSVYYTEISNVSLHVGFIDKLLGVGDIKILTGNDTNFSILDVEQPEKLFTVVQKVVLDIQTDIHYPNELRPGNNPGYNTKYKA